MSTNQFQRLLDRYPEVRAALRRLIDEHPEPIVREALGMPTKSPAGAVRPFTRAELETARAIGWDD